MYNMWDVYMADVAFEDNPSKTERCPIMIIADNLYVVLASKITHHKPRKNDSEDYPLIEWKKAGLKESSTVRIRRTAPIRKDHIYNKLGTIQEIDRNEIWKKIKDK